MTSAGLRKFRAGPIRCSVVLVPWHPEAPPLVVSAELVKPVETAIPEFGRPAVAVMGTQWRRWARWVAGLVPEERPSATMMHANI